MVRGLGIQALVVQGSGAQGSGLGWKALPAASQTFHVLVSYKRKP